ncbi:unnamed protein product [Thelazia callipaeda]|uniref:SERTA domain-containing protein n=1 Tax=Thelazia callipaeda TaxID=103827 RepID=A0A0N5CNJ4_THECL|nr:unnamed protein product [Thelazia callipaeda]
MAYYIETIAPENFDAHTSSSSSCSSDPEDDGRVDGSLSPRLLLTLAIQRRRVTYNSKERDLRRELLHTSVIQSLCKYLGERRARRRQQRRLSRRSRRRSNRTNRKREYSSSCGLETYSGVSAHPGVVVDNYPNYMDLAANEAESGGIESGTKQFVGCNDSLLSLYQDNCVQLPGSNGVKADNSLVVLPPPPPPPILPTPPASKKARCSYPDSDPFGLDKLFDELYGTPTISSGCRDRRNDVSNHSHESAITFECGMFGRGIVKIALCGCRRRRRMMI